MKYCKNQKRIYATIIFIVMVFMHIPVNAVNTAFVTDDFAQLTDASVEINDTTFPDADFQEYVQDNVDKNDDGYLSEKERDDVIELDL